MARWQTLYEWADEEFGGAQPSSSTLQKYAKSNMIFPPAQKIGRRWMVETGARYVGVLAKARIKETDHPILKRILMDGQ
ncbi:excisionase [Serratia quinivorans]|uniref:excisionase n=1 Tax=Serratia quinivorans TaxID=137545 RepID=UPI0021789DAE|nr:excisionase [Serratia quinivorans]CAI0968077.1 Excisionase-like protein [Serratia quinivorans]CAI2150584.1 Excisionase-like protein [Serratia quinivorans]